MRRETTTSRVAARPASSRSLEMLFGAIYGMAGGLTMALIVLSGLLPEGWTQPFTAWPLVFQAALTTTGALLGTLASLIRQEA